MAASHHGDTPYSGKTVTSVPATPYTTSVDVNRTGPMSSPQAYEKLGNHHGLELTGTSPHNA